MFDSILKNSGFIDLYMIKNYDLSNFSDEEIREFYKAINNHNKEYYSKLQKEISSYEITETVKDNDKAVDFVEELTIEDDDDIAELDPTFYINQLQSCPNINDIISYLPRRKNPDFNQIMNYLIMNIIKDIKDAEELLVVSNDEEKLEWKTFIDEKRALIDKLVEYRDDKVEEEEETEDKKNTVLFLQSTSGNYYALQDIKSIEKEYYESFEELLNSIIDGSFKNIKTFRNNKKLLGLIEVKGYQTRIVFRQINLTTYVVVAMFVKKYQNESHYKEYLTNRQNVYLSSELEIKSNINDEEYLQENDDIVNQLLEEFKNRGMSNGSGRSN